MTDSEDLDNMVGRHLRGVAAAVDVGTGDPSNVAARAADHRRRRRTQRALTAAACVAVIAAVSVVLVDVNGSGESSVDAVNTGELQPGPAGGEDSPSQDSEDRPPSVASFDDVSELVIAPVTALGTSWGVSVTTGSGGLEPNQLVLSQDGVIWHAAEGAPIMNGFAGIAGRDDLLVAVRGEGETLAALLFDGQRWRRSAIPSPSGAQLISVAASPSHLLALVDVPSPQEGQRRARSDEVMRRLEERFGPDVEFGLMTGPEGISYSVARNGELLFEGTAAELGLDEEEAAALFEGSPPASNDRRLYVTEDGDTWIETDPPPAGGDVPVAATGIGLVQAMADQFAYTADGKSWTTVSTPGMGPDNRVEVQAGDGYVIAATESAVYRAASMDGPFQQVFETTASGGFLATAVSWRGVVTLETTFGDAEDGVDSAAEAESLGQDPESFGPPEIATRVLLAADGLNFEPTDIAAQPGELLTLHTVAPDGWIVLRRQGIQPESVTMRGGYKIDPGG